MMAVPDEDYPKDETAGVDIAAFAGTEDFDDSGRTLDSLPRGVAILIVRHGRMRTGGAQYRINAEVTTVGRHPESDIFLDDVTVSRRHAEFRRDEHGYFAVHDLGSLNGVYVNRRKLTSFNLDSGDEVRIGKFRLMFLSGPMPQRPSAEGSRDTDQIILDLAVSRHRTGTQDDPHVDTNKATEIDAIPVSIFLGNGQNHEAVETALAKLLSESGLEPFGHEPPIIGSWFRKLLARVRQETAHLSMDQISDELERKLRIEVFEKAQAVIDNQQATGAAALIASLQGEQRACVRVGSILVLKIDGYVLVNNLTQRQLALLEREPNLLRDPEGVLKGLDELDTPRTTALELPPGMAEQT
jgi:pSer/pThr/pTyr-binding forkhead associated (FHA) protein